MVHHDHPRTAPTRRRPPAELRLADIQMEFFHPGQAGADLAPGGGFGEEKDPQCRGCISASCFGNLKRLLHYWNLRRVTSGVVSGRVSTIPGVSVLGSMGSAGCPVDGIGPTISGVTLITIQFFRGSSRYGGTALPCR